MSPGPAPLHQCTWPAQPQHAALCRPVTTSPYHLNPRMPFIKTKCLLDAIIDTFTLFHDIEEVFILR